MRGVALHVALHAHGHRPPRMCSCCAGLCELLWAPALWAPRHAQPRDRHEVRVRACTAGMSTCSRLYCRHGYKFTPVPRTCRAVRCGTHAHNMRTVTNRHTRTRAYTHARCRRRSILRLEWSAEVDQLLAPSARDGPDIAAAKAEWARTKVTTPLSLIIASVLPVRDSHWCVTASI
jgi:hypothetical protein